MAMMVKYQRGFGQSINHMVAMLGKNLQQHYASARAISTTPAHLVLSNPNPNLGSSYTLA